jgi:hypothetical protein
MKDTAAINNARTALQAEGKHPAPCARHCEATAFRIEERRLKATIVDLQAKVKHLTAELKDLNGAK